VKALQGFQNIVIVLQPVTYKKKQCIVIFGCSAALFYMQFSKVKVFRNFLIWLQIAFGLIFWMKEENRASKSPDGINVWVSFPFSILKFHGWWKLFQSGHSLIKRMSLLSKLNYVLISMDLKSKFDVFLILELHVVPSGDPAFSLVEQCQLPLDQPIKDKRK
jgi:hypothetical protein